MKAAENLTQTKAGISAEQAQLPTHEQRDHIRAEAAYQIEALMNMIVRAD